MEALRATAVGIAYMPDFLARDAIGSGILRTVLDECLTGPGQFSILWPSSKHLPPKLRVFVGFLSERLFLKTRQR
jgi:DNA-binding transcriptional LysR family regulator